MTAMPHFYGAQDETRQQNTISRTHPLPSSPNNEGNDILSSSGANVLIYAAILLDKMEDSEKGSIRCHRQSDLLLLFSEHLSRWLSSGRAQISILLPSHWQSTFYKHRLESGKQMMKPGLSNMFIASLMLSVFCPMGHGLRGALMRSGRSVNNNDNNWHEGREMFPEGGTDPHRFLILPLGMRQPLQQFAPSSPAEENAFLRFSRSLYDAGAESSSILRAQRGILQQEKPMVIDADDGQLMRYGR